jgi:hypothetical protein
MDYFTDTENGVFLSKWKAITKKEFETLRKKMLDEFGCQAIATLSNAKTGKIEAKVICWNTLKNTGIRGE